jgi:hypothetical protein
MAAFDTPTKNRSISLKYQKSPIFMGSGDAKKESIIIGQAWSKEAEMGQMTLLRKPTLL